MLRKIMKKLIQGAGGNMKIIEKYHEWLNSEFISEEDRRILEDMTDEESEILISGLNKLNTFVKNLCDETEKKIRKKDVE